jgi:ferrochelatase
MKADGVRRAAVVATSAYSSWSSCRQYLDNLRDAAAAVPDAPVLEKVRPYFNHPGFVDPVVDRTVEAIADLPEHARAAARILFVTHSVPTSMNDDSGPQGGAYLAQHLDLAAVVAERVEQRTGTARDHELVFCSRSGSPRTPWLEPDVNDRLEELAAESVAGVVLCPVGFVSDHMEVLYDLDTEALATCERLGIPARRSATAGTDPRFVGAVRELLLERAAVERGEAVQRPAIGEPMWDRCAVGCCAGRTERPALCGEDA